VGVALGGLVVYVAGQQDVFSINHNVALPVTHEPTFQGKHPFILGSGNVFQNGTAYSYVWINASAIKKGTNFTVFPAINVPLRNTEENNLKATITYWGSTFGSSPYWINFSIVISLLHFSANFSQPNISQNFSRSEFPLDSSQQGAEIFIQISSVVNSFDQFEFFFYVGDSSTPAPELAHGPVR
jgi:hypothetical protein